MIISFIKNSLSWGKSKLGSVLRCSLKILEPRLLKIENFLKFLLPFLTDVVEILLFITKLIKDIFWKNRFYLKEKCKSEVKLKFCQSLDRNKNNKKRCLVLMALNSKIIWNCVFSKNYTEFITICFLLIMILILFKFNCVLIDQKENSLCNVNVMEGVKPETG